MKDFNLKMDKAGDEKGAGGGQPEGGTITMTKDQFDALMAKIEGKGPGAPEKKDENDLADKARHEREAQEKAMKYEKSLERAINFNVSAKDFLKTNQSLLPKTVESIFAQAEKENYGSAVEKAKAIQVGVVSEFFAHQANHDLLTSSQKIQLDEFLRLTKNGKQERIDEIYSMIFEPTLESLKKIEKAKLVNSNDRQSTDQEKMLADRLMKLSKKHYLGDKDA